MHKLKLRRLELGFTQEEVVELTGISISTIQGIEGNKQHKIRFDVAAAIAEGLDSQLHTIFDARELSHLGRPAKTGRPIVNIASKRRGSRCANPVCNQEVSLAETSRGRSDCCNREVIAS
jgi:transcriptional regulator with XRE-family HTH domain